MTPIFDQLKDLATQNNVEVRFDSFLPIDGIVIPDEKGRATININPTLLNEEYDVNVVLAHELGHFFTKTYYNQNTPLELQQQCEITANLWAMNYLIPKEDLEMFDSAASPFDAPFNYVSQIPLCCKDIRRIMVKPTLYVLTPVERAILIESFGLNSLMAECLQVPTWYLLAVRACYYKADKYIQVHNQNDEVEQSAG